MSEKSHMEKLLDEHCIKIELAEADYFTVKTNKIFIIDGELIKTFKIPIKGNFKRLIIAYNPNKTIYDIGLCNVQVAQIIG